MEAKTTTTPLVRQSVPKEPTEFVSLDDVGEDCDQYYITVDANGWATVWEWNIGWGDEQPEHDRQFRIDEFEAVLEHLAKQDAEPVELNGVGHFRNDSGEVVLELYCGDTRDFEMPALRLLLRALKTMKPLEVDKTPTLVQS